MSDFQFIQVILEELTIEEFAAQDGHTLRPAKIHLRQCTAAAQGWIHFGTL
jgi:hypothetical protein